MSVIKKVMNVLRASVREIGEGVVDANATLAYEQEILDAKESIAQAKRELVGVMAGEMQSARRIEKLQAEIDRYEGPAAQVDLLEQELQAQTRAHAACALQVAKLKALVQSAEARIREHEREIGIAKTTQSVHRATRSIAENIGQGGVGARESLERIKRRHEELSDRMAAEARLDEELGPGALDKKLAAAGIGDDDGARRRRQVMDRIRARAAAGASGPARREIE